MALSFSRLRLLGFYLVTLCCSCNSASDLADVDATTPGKICEVHNIPLQEDVVPIRYGLIRPTAAEIEACRKLFPHAASWYQGGCVVKKATGARVSFCPKCRKAEAAWQANH
jgi:hypothetical protein